MCADQLQRAVEVNEYAEAARLLEAVQQLSAHFQSFVSIPKVAELGGRVSTLRRALQVQLLWRAAKPCHTGGLGLYVGVQVPVGQVEGQDSQRKLCCMLLTLSVWQS